MTGVDLQQLLLEKWGRSYDIQLRRIKDKVHVQVMWKYLEQASFPLSESEYLEHLNAIANYLHEWGGFSQFQAFIRETRERPRLGKAVSLALDLGERASEWLISDQWSIWDQARGTLARGNTPPGPPDVGGVGGAGEIQLI